jgi:hypothetical protein
MAVHRQPSRSHFQTRWFLHLSSDPRVAKQTPGNFFFPNAAHGFLHSPGWSLLCSLHSFCQAGYSRPAYSAPCSVQYNGVISTSEANSDHFDQLHLNVYISFPIQVKRKIEIVKYYRNSSLNLEQGQKNVYYFILINLLKLSKYDF